ncbi:MAG: PAS domain-containing hybrid sensor histidine kinase/response regulator [Desulfosalsimonas sp.]
MPPMPATEQEQRFRLIIENAGDLIFTVNETGVFKYISPNCRTILGYPQTAFEGRYFQPFVHPDDKDGILHALSGIFDEHKRYGGTGVNQRVVEFRAITSDGQWKWMSAKNTVLEEIRGEYELAIIARDITDQKEIESRLRKSEERYRELFENAPVGIFRTNEKGEALLANSTMARILGFLSSQDAVDYYNDLENELYADPERRRQFLDLIRQKGHVENFEYEAKTKCGSSVWLSMNARMENFDETGGFIIEGFVVDITERKRAERENMRLQRQFHQAQKMESIGRLAGGVAHDLNNLLSPILGYSEMLFEDMAGNDSRKKHLGEILSAGKRARALVRQLLAFSRKQALQFQVIDVNALLDNFKNLLRRTLREDIALHMNMAGSLPRVEGDPGQLEQVIMNLAVNAQDAMPSGGQLVIETVKAELDETYASKKTEVVPGTYVMIAISDTGAGMDADTVEHLFEPFFTTKEKDKGTGLGLATSYGIVKQHGGNIWAYSEPGMGSTFRIYLPVTEKSPDACIHSPAPRTAAEGSGTILIVEDDSQVRNLASTVLERSGYAVIAAESGQQAMEALQSHGGEVRLLLTDVIMPDMNGRKVFENVASLYPEVRVLYMSGYTDDVIAHHGVIDQGVDFIQKPFTLKALASKVQEMLQDEK